MILFLSWLPGTIIHRFASSSLSFMAGLFIHPGTITHSFMHGLFIHPYIYIYIPTLTSLVNDYEFVDNFCHFFNKRKIGKILEFFFPLV